MLTKIALLNSGPYNKAVIDLDRDTIQLVGSNNVGKSSLIYALNFLYIIAPRYMQFSGDKSYPESINFYFKNSEQSFIIFEVYKKTYFCIVITRKADKLYYYRLNGKFQENWFTEVNGEKMRIKQLNEVNQKLLENAMELQFLKDLEAVFKEVYSQEKQGGKIVWTKGTVKKRGYATNFTKIYRYLINSKLIDNESLKNALIIADNKENEDFRFDKKAIEEIERLWQINAQIKKYESVEALFKEFKEDFQKYIAIDEKARELKYQLLARIEAEVPELYRQEREIKQEIEGIKQEKEQKQKKRDEALNMQTNKKRDAEDINVEIKKLEEKISATYKLDTKEFINQKIYNIDEQIEKISFKLGKLNIVNYSQNQLQQHIKKMQRELESLQKQLHEFDHLLMLNISDHQKTRQLLSHVLSDEIKRSNKSLIINKVGGIQDGTLSIGDGSIDISSIDIKNETQETRKQIEKEIRQHQDSIKEKNDLLTDLQSKKELKKNKQKLEKQKQNQENNLRMLEELPSWETTLQNKKQSYNQLNEKILPDIAKEIRQLEKLNESFTEKINKEYKKQSDCEKEKNKLEDIRKYAKNLNYEPKEPESHSQTSALNIKNHLEKVDSERQEIGKKKNEKFHEIKHRTNREESDEEQLIEALEDEFASLEQKNESVEQLLANLSEQFSRPVDSLLNQYRAFDDFINSFNRALKKYRISDIDRIKLALKDNDKLLKDMRKIAKLENVHQYKLTFDEDENSSLSVLQKHINDKTHIKFENLFSLQFLVTKNGKEKRVDVGRQIESDGTDRVIKLMIFLSIVSNLIESSQENKLVFYVDELAQFDRQNISEIIRFCKENYFIPIFAAPMQIQGGDIEKFYYLKPNANNQLVIDDNYAAYARKNGI